MMNEMILYVILYRSYLKQRNKGRQYVLKLRRWRRDYLSVHRLGVLLTRL